MSGGREFENLAYDDDYDGDVAAEDEEARLLPQASSLDDTFLVDPTQTADTLRNEQAKQDFYKFVRSIGWEQEHGDLDENSLIEHRATIHKDKFTGKVYVHYQGKDVKLTKKVGSGFAKPSTIAKNAKEKGFNGNRFVRDVLGVKNYGVRVIPQYPEPQRLHLWIFLVTRRIKFVALTEEKI